MDGLVRLAYFSSVSSTWTPFDTPSILQVSRKNNRRLGITGMLLHDKRNYLQILEGEARLVGRLFGTIELDTRHAGVTEILRESVSRREFPDWSMGYRDLSQLKPRAEGCAQVLQGHFDLGALDLPGTLSLFRLMKKLA
jgi:hypothetical protein